jgi:K+-transporting ATPase ATPase A chain
MGCMALLFLAGVLIAYSCRSPREPAAARHRPEGERNAARRQHGRQGSALRHRQLSALYATVTTDASCGCVNSMHDSFTPLGGMVPMINIMLGEVVFGGVGAGLYGIIVFVILAVFIAGLMVGRTPEYLGKKIEAYDVKMAMLSVLIFLLSILVFTAIAVVNKFGTRAFRIPDPHGLSQILYAYTSSTGNNGSAFRRAQREHALVQRIDRLCHAAGPLFSSTSRSWRLPAIWRARSSCPNRRARFR